MADEPNTMPEDEEVEAHRRRVSETDAPSDQSDDSDDDFEAHVFARP